MAVCVCVLCFVYVFVCLLCVCTWHANVRCVCVCLVIGFPNRAITGNLRTGGATNGNAQLLYKEGFFMHYFLSLDFENKGHESENYKWQFFASFFRITS